MFLFIAFRALDKQGYLVAKTFLQKQMLSSLAARETNFVEANFASWKRKMFSK